MRILYVHKYNPQDPTDQALRKHFLGEVPGTEVFAFTSEERSRKSSPKDGPLRRLQEAVEKHGTTHVFSWVPYLNAAEVRWLKERGLVVASAQSGVSTLSHGYMQDQAEYLAYLRSLDFFFIPHAPHVPVLRGAGVKAVELPFCVDEDIYRPLAVGGLARSLAPFSGSYIGNFGDPRIAQGRYRAEVLKEIASVFRLLLVCDLRYKEYGLDRSRLLRLPTVTSPALLNFLLNASGFTIGTDAFPEIDDYYRPQYTNVQIPYDRARDGFVMRPRSFWSMGAGVPFVVEDYPDIRRYFRAGEEVLLWGSPRHAVEQLESFRREPARLREIGERGRAKVLRLHSARRRVRQIQGILAGGPVPDFTAEAAG